jgi:hypothetical protein
MLPRTHALSLLQADFTTCDFQFVEDVMSGAAKVSPVDCDRKCATQWPVVSGSAAATSWGWAARFL